jgi:flagellar basal-body rod modification protein FlgD
MDGISFSMTATEIARLRSQNESFNLALSDGRVAKTELGKDEFLKILLTQLTNQDPMEPMNDREFVAQMAQFSALEQMTNMASEFQKLGALIEAGQAFSILGRTVDLVIGDSVVAGRVEEVIGGEYPQVLVNGTYYDYADVRRVRE